MSMSEAVSDEIQAGARKSVFTRHLTYFRALAAEQRQFSETVREAWGQAKKDRIHAEAARLVVRLELMEPRKAADFLRAFDAYRGWSRLDSQADLFEAPAAAADTPPPPKVGLGRQTAPGVKPAFPKIGPNTPEEPFEDGAQSCRLGVDATLNPYDPDKAPDEYEEWSQGWTATYTQGHWMADLADEDDDDAT